MENALQYKSGPPREATLLLQKGWSYNTRTTVPVISIILNGDKSNNPEAQLLSSGIMIQANQPVQIFKMNRFASHYET